MSLLASTTDVKRAFAQVQHCLTAIKTADDVAS